MVVFGVAFVMVVMMMPQLHALLAGFPGMRKFVPHLHQQHLCCNQKVNAGEQDGEQTVHRKKAKEEMIRI